MSAAALNPPPSGDGAPDTSERPAPGTVVMDEVRKKIGVVIDDPYNPRIVLRPEGGGIEWEAERVHPVTASERLSPHVAKANRRSRGEVL